MKQLCPSFKSLFGVQPKPYFSPLDHEDHPELDDTALCGPDDTAKFQSLIGACQWMIFLCHLDIAHAIMLLSQFCQCPQIEHIEWLKHVCSYICKFPQGGICICTGTPNHEEVFGEHSVKYDWMETVYGNPIKEIPLDSPVPKGNPVQMTTYCHANLLHDIVTGRSVTGILPLFNQTPIEWFSKWQNQVESATYGSEFMAA